MTEDDFGALSRGNHSSPGGSGEVSGRKPEERRRKPSKSCVIWVKVRKWEEVNRTEGTSADAHRQERTWGNLRCSISI